MTGFIALSLLSALLYAGLKKPAAPSERESSREPA
jgi:hypothetical protein